MRFLVLTTSTISEYVYKSSDEHAHMYNLRIPKVWKYRKSQIKSSPSSPTGLSKKCLGHSFYLPKRITLSAVVSKRLPHLFVVYGNHKFHTQAI